ncbi:MAG: putative DNA binding domain-containing protein [Candidatus Cloacimonadota bacterium]|nr:putative DNA binding domain-containing protein [Candidatus Cloacimonadota bacterium]
MNLFKKLIKKGESKTLEFKEKLPENEKIAKTIISFSNTSGGKLVIGINDRNKIVGLGDIDIFDIQDKIISIIYDSCYPNILPEIYTINVESKLLLIIEVNRGNLLPYYLKKEGKNYGTYLRIGSSNRKASLDNIMELERNRRNISFDEEINYGIEFETLDITGIISRFKKFGKTLDTNKLLNLKLIKKERGKLFPSNALLILLGKFENCLIKCSRFKGETMEIFLDKKEYDGNIFDQLEKAETFIKSHINLRGEIKGLQRTDTYEIPIEAIREALINALIHRDYVNMGRDIKVGIYDDIINIVSPGNLPNSLTENELDKGRSEIRNKTIARIFKELAYIEQWGSGIKRIKLSCLKVNLKEPLIREIGDSVDIEFYRKKEDFKEKSSKKIRNVYAQKNNIFENERQAKAIEYIKNNNQITNKEYQMINNISRATASRDIQYLVEKDILKNIGTKGSSAIYILF